MLEVKDSKCTSTTRLWCGNIKRGTKREDVWDWFEDKGFKPCHVNIKDRPGKEESQGFIGFLSFNTLAAALNRCNGKAAPWIVSGKFVTLRPADEDKSKSRALADAQSEEVRRRQLEAHCIFFEK